MKEKIYVSLIDPFLNAVQLRHKERQLEQKEASGQQEVSTMTEKVESLTNLLEEEHIQLVRMQEKLDTNEAQYRQSVADLRKQLQESARQLEAEQQRHYTYQAQQQRRVKELMDREEITKRSLEDRNQKLKEQEKMFSTYQTQVQNQKKVMEQSEAAKQQTIATLSAEVVRLTRQGDEQTRRGSTTQSRENDLIEQDRVNRLNISALSEKLRERETIISSYQVGRGKHKQKEGLMQENEINKARVRELTTSRLTQSPNNTPPPTHRSNLESQLDEMRRHLEEEREERAREQETSQQMVASLTSRVEEVAARSPPQANTSRSRSSSRVRSPSKRDPSPGRVTFASDRTDNVNQQQPGSSSSSSNSGDVGGLPNLGNTCYINSVLQCLFSITTFRDYFTSDAYKRDVSRGSEQQGQVAAAVAGVAKGLQGSSGRDLLTRVKHLKEVAGVCNEDFRGTHQRNAHDFLSALLTWLHDDTTRPSGASIITKLFDGERRTTVWCERSGEEIQRSTQIFTTLTLTVPPGKSYSLMKVEWECKKVCRKTHVCRQTTRIRYLPPILIIYLSRTSSSRDRDGQVRKTRVTFPSDRLSLLDYLDHRDRNSPSYDLFAVINHHGSANSGHYTAYCRGPTQSTWRYYDDQKVTETSLQRVLAEVEVHILFYVEKR
ncbi:hypothetical protein Pcinc_030235 [Petrolisthes cinctipes]|uniref:Ubiquitin carboxyl-terminal hydrolase n=1 Tax=Petrolisthes cinctipes TaxID=88211 RepID=A0AAE1K6A8_PETCI|nr:hypothetical protein Pcinc_030235 [Petrolisthes cinctipes]